MVPHRVRYYALVYMILLIPTVGINEMISDVVLGFIYNKIQ